MPYARKQQNIGFEIPFGKESSSTTETEAIMGQEYQVEYKKSLLLIILLILLYLLKILLKYIQNSSTEVKFGGQEDDVEIKLDI